ncbi:hypothetical protein [Solirubrum puertoriconensis]|uniref:Uncharacterized protein n=1 Tax=Solirubrum puertoriconensis TaxID=1751427 RepID=A0A9X0HNN1_SOLP1|nr:hypothetical protein [Solirubrum puertoriconensis]KUG09215.1 hypothetical protein ASU33_20855 [Solirubrum puertoriconensis]
MFLTSQKNLLYKAAQDLGFNMQDFSLVETPPVNKEVKGLKLTHKPTGYYFRLAVLHAEVDQYQAVIPSMYLFCTPNRQRVVLMDGEQNTHAGVKDWDTTVQVLKNWLAWLKAEAAEPDLWTSLEDAPSFFAEDAAITDEMFTPAEIKQLQERVQEVQERVSTLELPEEAADAIKEVVREIPNKAKRLTKRELADIVFSTVVKEAFKWGLTAEHLQYVWNGCKYLFTVTYTALR